MLGKVGRKNEGLLSAPGILWFNSKVWGSCNLPLALVKPVQASSVLRRRLAQQEPVKPLQANDT